jgi:hypothetical protein
LDNLKLYRVGNGPEKTITIDAVDLFGIVNNVNLKPYEDDEVGEKACGWVMRTKSRKDIHLLGLRERSKSDITHCEHIWFWFFEVGYNSRIRW